MRWAFFLLLFVNAAFLIWHQLHQPSNEPVAVSATKSPGGNKSIRLLHEVESGTKSPAETSEPANTSAQRTRDPARASADDAALRPGAARNADNVRTPPPVTPVIETVPPLTELERKVLAAEARQAERIEANLAARKNEERAARERPRPAAEPAATACFALGPFSVLSNAESVMARLVGLGLGLRTTVREHEIRSTQQWWVIEATKDERAANKRLEELRKKKVADASIISNGEYENMISLGKYDSEAQANKRVNALVKLGFRPVVEKHFDSTTQYWVDVDENARRSITAAQIKDVVSGTEKVEKQQRACK
ncbi:MAG: hypothetical protein HY273_11200 [Gammaproteobacteria bacterium]|nr:hypothetical protein [Gammaproteobacteria bacterium]